MEYLQDRVVSDKLMVCALKSPKRRELIQQLVHFLSDQLCECRCMYNLQMRLTPFLIQWSAGEGTMGT